MYRPPNTSTYFLKMSPLNTFFVVYKHKTIVKIRALGTDMILMVNPQFTSKF